MNNGKRLDVESLMCTIIEARAHNYNRCKSFFEVWVVDVKFKMTFSKFGR